jgi:hypothetical protein
MEIPRFSPLDDDNAFFNPEEFEGGLHCTARR